MDDLMTGSLFRALRHVSCRVVQDISWQLRVVTNSCQIDKQSVVIV